MIMQNVKTSPQNMPATEACPHYFKTSVKGLPFIVVGYLIFSRPAIVGATSTIYTRLLICPDEM